MYAFVCLVEAVSAVVYPNLLTIPSSYEPNTVEKSVNSIETTTELSGLYLSLSFYVHLVLSLAFYFYAIYLSIYIYLTTYRTCSRSYVCLSYFFFLSK